MTRADTLQRRTSGTPALKPPWDPPRAPLEDPESRVHLHHNTKEMNANSFPNKMRFGPENRWGLLLFVAEPPGALYTYLVVSFA